MNWIFHQGPLESEKMSLIVSVTLIFVMNDCVPQISLYTLRCVENSD